MATSNSFLRVEEHIRDEWLERRFGQKFTKRSVSLRTKGTFEFDAVSPDGDIVGCISANSGRARQGGLAKTKMNKIRSDIMFLMLSKAQRRLMILTDADLYAHSVNEQKRGRLPCDIDICHAKLSDEFQALLSEAQKAASIEIIAEA